MNINYKTTTIILSVWVITLTSVVAVLAATGTTDSPAAPGSTNFYTLEDIYDRLDSGAAGTQSTFTEPSVAPGTGTMHDLNDIMSKAPALDNTNGATITQVISGTTFWGLNVASGQWGLQTGTLEPVPCDCSGGTLNGTRWCDNGDGTVTDLLGYNGVGQCLEWAQNASWGGQKPWRNSSTDCSSPYTCYDDAHARASAYGGETGNWRLPTRAELNALTHGTEQVRPESMRAFTGVQSSFYWSGTTYASLPSYAWDVNLYNGWVGYLNKAYSHYVWPVRGGQ